MELSLSDFLYHVKDNHNDLKLRVNTEFMGHCMKNIDQTCSQNFQDQFALYVKEKINPVKKGFFVEFGGADAIEGSNTYVLEQAYEWDGIIAEPNPDYHEELMRHRRAQVSYNAVSDKNGDAVFVKTYDAALSTLKGYGTEDEHAEARKGGVEIEVDTVTLFTLLKDLKAPELIDYISVDTEGSEYDILKKFFEENNASPVKYTINCFTVEHNYQPEARKKIQELMEANGFMNIFREFSRWDDFYIRKGNMPVYGEPTNREFVYRT